MGRVTISSNNLFPGPKGEKGEKGDAGATGAKGDTGATGAQGSSGVVSVTSPITNSGTSTAANIGINQTEITLTQSQVTNLITDLAAKVPASTFSAKGVIAVGTGSGTYSAQTVGSNGQVLTANSAQSDGVEWATLTAGSTSTAGILQLTDSTSSTSTTTAATPNSVKTAYDLALPKLQTLTKISGQYFRTPLAQYAANAPTNTTTYYTPIYVDKSGTFDRIAIVTSSLFSGTGSVRLGIYNNTNTAPSTLLLDAGTVSVSAASTAYTITISQTLSEGFYWLAFCQQGTAPTIGSYIGSVNSQVTGNILFNTMAGTPTNNLATGYFQSSVTGAFANASSPTITTNTPYVWIRAA